MPIRRASPLAIVTKQFVKLTPCRSNFAVAALPSMPAFIIGRSEPPHGAFAKCEAAHLLRFGMVHKWVEQELKLNLRTAYFNFGRGNIWFCIPTVVQTLKQQARHR